MAKPIPSNPVADLPTNWQSGQIVSPGGTEVGLTAKHGYNYLAQKINEALVDLGLVNDFAEVLSNTIASLVVGGKVPASNVSAGTLSGKVVANATSVASSDGQVRNIYYGVGDPDNSIGNNGDVYLELEA